MSTAMPNLVNTIYTQTNGFTKGEQARQILIDMAVKSSIVPAYAAKIDAMSQVAAAYFVERSDDALLSAAYESFVRANGKRELFWVSEEFTNLILDAADDFDDGPEHDGQSKLTSEIDLRSVKLPADSGCLIFERPVHLPVREDVLDATSDVELMPLRGIAWVRVSDRQAISYGDGSGGHTVSTHVIMGIMHARNKSNLERCTMILSSVEDFIETDIRRFVHLDPMTVLCAFSYLLDQPSVTSDDTMSLPSLPAPSVRGSKKKAKRVKQPDVRVITLNPRGTSKAVYERMVAMDDGELVTSKRDFQHKWMVRGHWRNQPYPSQGEGVTKPIWIAPYIKGPDDKPLLTTPRVHAIRHI